MKHIEKYMKTIILISSFTIALGVLLTQYNNFMNKFDKIQYSIEVVNKTSLKSVIWNDGVPIVDRLGACDTYLDLNFNSYTSNHCERLLKSD